MTGTLDSSARSEGLFAGLLSGFIIETGIAEQCPQRGRKMVAPGVSLGELRELRPASPRMGA